MEMTMFEKISLWRKRRDMTQGELADKAGVSRNSISMMERGEYNPTIEQLNKIAKALLLELIVDVKERGPREIVNPPKLGSPCQFERDGSYCESCGRGEQI